VRVITSVQLLSSWLLQTVKYPEFTVRSRVTEGAYKEFKEKSWMRTELTSLRDNGTPTALAANYAMAGFHGDR
jgi:hypothetical protein